MRSAFFWAIIREGVRRGIPLAEQPLPPDVPAGMPSSLLERRPDIREAEQQLDRCERRDRRRQSRTSFRKFRSPDPGAARSGAAALFTGLMSSQTGIWTYGAQVSSAHFHRRRTARKSKLAESQDRQELIAYKQAIQLAFGDVSDALIGYQKLHEVRVAQETTVKDLQDSVSTSLVRYRGGTTTYLEVLDGQRSLFTAELALAQARGNEYQSLVQLYKALGGGWQ